jgi:MFS-type transporter involved in bile tolerance (Atg22 family)
MSFRKRLALFLIATLILVQGVTALFAYGVIRGTAQRALRASER